MESKIDASDKRNYFYINTYTKTEEFLCDEDGIKKALLFLADLPTNSEEEISINCHNKIWLHILHYSLNGMKMSNNPHKFLRRTFEIEELRKLVKSIEENPHGV